jgi:hypothetical protein
LADLADQRAARQLAEESTYHTKSLAIQQQQADTQKQQVEQEELSRKLAMGLTGNPKLDNFIVLNNARSATIKSFADAAKSLKIKDITKVPGYQQAIGAVDYAIWEPKPDESAQDYASTRMAVFNDQAQVMQHVKEHFPNTPVNLAVSGGKKTQPQFRTNTELVQNAVTGLAGKTAVTTARNLDTVVRAFQAINNFDPLGQLINSLRH